MRVTAGHVVDTLLTATTETITDTSRSSCVYFTERMKRGVMGGQTWLTTTPDLFVSVLGDNIIQQWRLLLRSSTLVVSHRRSDFPTARSPGAFHARFLEMTAVLPATQCLFVSSAFDRLTWSTKSRTGLPTGEVAQKSGGPGFKPHPRALLAASLNTRPVTSLAKPYHAANPRT